MKKCTSKKISPEDREVLLVLEILKNQTQEMKIMAKTIAEAVTAVQEVKAENKVYFQKVLDAFNRLEAKIQAGSDAQAIVDEVALIKEELAVKEAEADLVV